MVIITARKISTSRFDRVTIVTTSSLEATSKPVSPAHPCGSLSPTSISVRTSPPAQLNGASLRNATRKIAHPNMLNGCRRAVPHFFPLSKDPSPRHLFLKIGRCLVIGRAISCPGRTIPTSRPWSSVIPVTDVGQGGRGQKQTCTDQPGISPFDRTRHSVGAGLLS